LVEMCYAPKHVCLLIKKWLKKLIHLFKQRRY
jgi:hypothetical protein